MNNGLRIAAFTAAVAATFGTAYAVGQGIDPVVAEQGSAPHEGHAEQASNDAESEPGPAQEKSAAEEVGGLQVSRGGYTLDLETPRIEAGERTELRFTIDQEGPGGNLKDYRREHGKELHLILASDDLTAYRHLHPTRTDDGTWSAPVDLPKAGGYRVFADFTPDKKGAEALTLGADLGVSGAYEPKAPPKESAVAKVDGYEVKLAGDLKAGTSNELTLSVSKDGKPVTDLQPYLGAYGHLVALRSGDLAYLHVHPNGEPGDGKTEPGPQVSFSATAPSAGTYRLFLDFRHDGKVRTAPFTVQVGAPSADAEKGEGSHEGSGEGSPDGHAH